MTNLKVASREWVDIGSDVCWEDHGGLWARWICKDRYFVLQFENCESWGDGATGYHVSLSEVDLSYPNPEALRSADVPLDGRDEYGNPIGKETYRLMQVAAYHGHGAKAPLFDESGTNIRKLVAAAKREARQLASRAHLYDARMSRPVNAIGSTAREYQQGDLQSGILRGVAAGDPKAELMLRLGAGRK